MGHKRKNNTIPQAEGVSTPSNKRLMISFKWYKGNCVNIHNKFCNHFQDINHVKNIYASFLHHILPILSITSYRDFINNKASIGHCHQIKDSIDIDLIRDILKEYGLNNTNIDQIINGETELGQLKASQKDSAARIVYYLSDGCINFLFFDTNHHIYQSKNCNHAGTYKYSYDPTKTN